MLPLGVEKMRYMILSLLLLCSCSAINAKLGQEDDWLGEEILESAIEIKTGIDVDLTPGTPE